MFRRIAHILATYAVALYRNALYRELEALQRGRERLHSHVIDADEAVDRARDEVKNAEANLRIARQQFKDGANQLDIESREVQSTLANLPQVL